MIDTRTNQEKLAEASTMVDKLNETLEAAGKRHHQLQPVHDEKSATDAWTRVDKIFKEVAEEDHESEYSIELMTLCLNSKRIFYTIALNRKTNGIKLMKY